MPLLHMQVEAAWMYVCLHLPAGSVGAHMLRAVLFTIVPHVQGHPSIHHLLSAKSRARHNYNAPRTFRPSYSMTKAGTSRGDILQQMTGLPIGEPRLPTVLHGLHWNTLQHKNSCKKKICGMDFQCNPVIRFNMSPSRQPSHSPLTSP